MNAIFKTLPMELKHRIMEYNRQFYWKNGQLCEMGSFSKEDPRFEMLKNIPEKVYYESWTDVKLWIKYEKESRGDLYYSLCYADNPTENTYECAVDIVWEYRPVYDVIRLEREVISIR
jgi:hypothetical protein